MYHSNIYSQSSEEDSPVRSPSNTSTSLSTVSRNITYTLFVFDVNLKKTTFLLPADVAETLPEKVEYSRVKAYLKPKKGRLLFNHGKCLAIHCFDKQEACSSGGKYSMKLRDSMIDRKRMGYVVLPKTDNLRAAEVYDGGVEFKDADVNCVMDGDKVHVTYKVITAPRPHIPLSEKQRTQNLLYHLEKYILEKNLPLDLKSPRKTNIANLCRFTGGGDVTVSARKGVVVIGGTSVIDERDITPLKEGDVTTTTSVETKLPTNPTTYRDAEQQLFANMHMSASEAVIDGLLCGEIEPSEVKRILAYGSILKPGSNLVALYKLVAEFNKDTYVQIDYQVETIYWHNFFDGVLLYMLNRLICNDRPELTE